MSHVLCLLAAILLSSCLSNANATGKCLIALYHLHYIYAPCKIYSRNYLIILTSIYTVMTSSQLQTVCVLETQWCSLVSLILETSVESQQQCGSCVLSLH